jgi:hypothetical protein
MVTAGGHGGFLMPGFYTNRSQSYNFDSDYLDFPFGKSLRIGNEEYFFGYEYDVPLLNSFYTTDTAGNRIVGPKIDRRPRGIISDGYGGSFIYGTFNYVNEKYRKGIAHFNSSGHLTEWNAGLNGDVFDVVIKDTTVYVGGFFTQSKGVVRRYLAAFSLSGQLLTWNPSAQNAVEALDINGDNIYVGGDFTSIGGLVRPYLAAVNTAGSVLAWNPNANNVVESLLYSGVNAGIYIGGFFTTINGNTRNRLAFVDPVTINSTSGVYGWDPNANGAVNSIKRFGSNIYIGGQFTSVNGNARNYLAAVSITGNVLAWNPSADNWIETLYVDSSNIYAGGSFTYINGVIRPNFAVINTNGNLQDYTINAYADSVYRYDYGFIQKYGSNVYSYSAHYPADRTFGIYKNNTSSQIGKFLNVNRDIYDAVSIGDNIYFGGNFTRVGGSWSSLAIYSTAGNDVTNLFVTSQYSDYSAVYAIAGAGIDEAYIVGYFDNINGIKRPTLAKINHTSGTVLDLNIHTNTDIYCIAVVGDNIYFGGFFTSVNGVQRNYLAAVNSSGQLLNWNPSADSSVRDLVVSGNNIYFGGNFASVAGQTRNRLAVVNTSGSLLTWNPNVNNTVRSLLINGNDIYIGGFFTSINGNVRNYLAAVNTSGNVLAWNPNANNATYAMAVSDNTIYIGGTFTSVNGNVRNRLAAVNTANVNATGNVLAWNPSADSSVYAIDVSGSNVYVGGYFYNVSSTSRTLLAAINTSGSLLSWNPFIGDDWQGAPEALKVLGTNVYCGWYYPELFGPNVAVRSFIAAVNTSGSILAWNPSSNGFVVGLAVKGTNIYFGGSFTSVGGNSSRLRLAGITTAGTFISHGFNVNNTVQSLAFNGNNLYFTGTFNVVSQSKAQNFAGFNTAAFNEVLEIAPFFPQAVSGIEVQDNTIYVKGDFTNFGSNTSLHMVTQSGIENSVTQVNSHDSTFGNIDVILPDGSGGVYIGGFFDFVDGKRRQNLAHINSSGLVTSWNPNANGSVYSLVQIGNNIYIGGSFTSLSSQSRFRLGAINASGSLLTWNPSVNSSVHTMVVSENNIYIGGNFSSINGNARNCLAAVNTTGNVLAWNPSAGGSLSVCALAISGDNIYIGGLFTSMNGNVRNRLAAVNTTGNVLAWNPSANSIVYALTISGVNIYIGGDFTGLGLTARNRVGAVNVSGSLLTWNPNANGLVRGIASNGVNVYFGGDFTTIDGAVRNRVAAENVSGTLLDWNPNLTSSCFTLAIANDNVYIGGRVGISGISPLGSNYLAVMDINGSTVGKPTVQLQKSVRSFKVSGDNIYVGGFSFNSSINTLLYTGNYLYLTNKDGKELKRYAINRNSTSAPGVFAFTQDSSGGIYIGGEFESIDGIAAKNIAYINSLGSIVSWNVSTNDTIHQLKFSNNIIYIGGWFTEVNGQARHRIAAVNTSGSLLPWNPSASSNVYDIVVFGNEVYIGGTFTSVNGNVRNRLAAIQTPTINAAGSVTSWNPNADGLVARMDIIGSNIYFGGSFVSVTGVTRRYLAAVNTAGSLLSWNPSAGGGCYALDVLGDNIYVGGDFLLVAGSPRPQFAVLNTNGNLQTLNPNIIYNINNIPTWYTQQPLISCIEIDGSNIYISGLNMISVDNQLRPGGFAINTSGSLLPFSAHGNWTTRISKFGDNLLVAPSLALSSQSITPIYGGESTISNFVTLNKSNLLLKSINIDTDSSIYDILIKDESMVIDSKKQVFDVAPSYKISDERALNLVNQELN